MAYGCKQCIGKLKEEFAEKYNGEFLCRLEGSVVNCNPETDVVEDNKTGEGLGYLGILGLSRITYRCGTINKKYTVPACSFGGHPHWSHLALMEIENKNLREGVSRDVEEVELYIIQNYGEKFLKILNDLLDNNGFEPIVE